MTASARFLTAALALGLAFTTAACDSTEPGGDDQEFISRVTVQFTNASNPADIVTIVANVDEDGQNPTFTPAVAALRAGAIYNATIRLEDARNPNDIENITEEIEAEADEHLFAYSFNPAAFGTVTITDTERDYRTSGRALPVGLTLRVNVAAGTIGTGTLRAILYHFDDPAQKTSGASTSDERDIDINFPMAVAPGV